MLRVVFLEMGMDRDERPGPDAGKQTGFWKRVGMWLDRWCLLGHCHDTHGWHAKQEVLRQLKRTERQKH